MRRDLRRDSLPDDLGGGGFKGSLNDLLERKGKRPRMSSASVSAVELPKPIARTRDGAAGALGAITETCFTDQGEPVLSPAILAATPFRSIFQFIFLEQDDSISAHIQHG